MTRRDLCPRILACLVIFTLGLPNPAWALKTAEPAEATGLEELVTAFTGSPDAYRQVSKAATALGLIPTPTTTLGLSSVPSVAASPERPKGVERAGVEEITRASAQEIVDTLAGLVQGAIRPSSNFLALPKAASSIFVIHPDSEDYWRRPADSSIHTSVWISQTVPQEVREALQHAYPLSSAGW